MQRKLFAEVRAGRPAASLKRAYVKDTRSARMFNGVRVSLEGKIASVREAQKLHRDILQRRIARAERQISDAVRRAGGSRSIRSGAGWPASPAGDDSPQGDTALFRVQPAVGKQHHLEANGYPPVLRSGWPIGRMPAAVSSSCWGAGMRPGAASCVWRRLLTMAHWLRLRMPDCQAGEHGKYLVIEGVKFTYGHEQVLAALGSNAELGLPAPARGEGGESHRSGPALNYFTTVRAGGCW